GGRLPVTFYKSETDLPAFEDYQMAGRTYRYFTGEPLYPFGYGLSYSHFEYSNLTLDKTQITENETLTASIDVGNVSDRSGDEVVQVYISAHASGYPLQQLVAFKRVHLLANSAQRVEFTIPVQVFTRV